VTPVTIDVYGKIYIGSYEDVDEGMVRVSSVGLGSKVAQISNSTAELVARMLLRELVREAQKKKQTTDQEHTV
jgi:hypothetical protein